MGLFVSILTGYRCSCGINFTGSNYATDALEHILANPSHRLTGTYTNVPSVELFLIVVGILFIIAMLNYSEIKHLKKRMVIQAVKEVQPAVEPEVPYGTVNESGDFSPITDEEYERVLNSWESGSDKERKDMAISYLYGYNGEISVKKAVSLMDRSSKQTAFGKPYYDAAMCYIQGKNVEQSYEKALSCLQKSSSCGFEAADPMIKDVKLMMKGSKKK